MQLTTFTILVSLFLLFALSRAYLRYRDSVMSLRQFIFWVIVWVGGGTVLVYPRNTGEVAGQLGLGSGADVIVYTSVIALFYLAFRVYAAINILQHEITRLVRAIALERRDIEDLQDKNVT